MTVSKLNTEQLASKLAQQLNISKEQAESYIQQELKRKAAGEKYRTSESYRLRLQQQKAVRLALKSA